MFARNVSFRLKPNGVAEFTETIEKNIIPLLRKQRGFQDEITFVDPEKLEAIGISLWENKADVDAYNRGTYPEVLRGLAKVVEGTPQVRTFEVCNSTFHKVAARAVAF
jgi:heme-degrading monooxygenase HmoA